MKNQRLIKFIEDKETRNRIIKTYKILGFICAIFIVLIFLVPLIFKVQKDGEFILVQILALFSGIIGMTFLFVLHGICVLIDGVIDKINRLEQKNRDKGDDMNEP